MKLASSLLLLTCEAKRGGREKTPHDKKLKAQKEGNRKLRTAALDDVSVTCETMFAAYDGDDHSPVFLTTSKDQNTSGTVVVEDYGDHMHCYQDIVTDCEQGVKIKVKSLAIEACGDACTCDEFGYSWNGGSQVSSEHCGCHGEGCNDTIYPSDTVDDDGEPLTYGDYTEDDYSSFTYYAGSLEEALADYDYFDQKVHLPGHNTFRFLFRSDYSWSHGGLELEWSCIDPEATTTASTAQTTSVYPYNPTTSEPTTTEDNDVVEYTVYEGTGLPTEDCEVELVYNSQLCQYNADGSVDWISDFMRNRYPRQARYQEVKDQEGNWKYDMGTWYIVGFWNGYTNGPGYGSNIEFTGEQRPDPGCKGYGASLMCRDLTYEETTTTASTTSWQSTTSTYYYYDYYTSSSSSSTTSIVSTPYDDSCYKYHAGFDEFANQLKSSVMDALTNDIYSYSRVPGKITNGAQNRRAQWGDWFFQIVDNWNNEIDDGEGRKCLTDNFPYDSPGDLGKDILGSDCALDMTSIDSICENLKTFLEWSFEGCRTQRLITRLENRCNNVKRIRNEIQMASAAKMVDDIETANRQITRTHQQQLQKNKGRYSDDDAARRGKKSKGKKSKGKKPSKKSSKNKKQ